MNRKSFDPKYIVVIILVIVVIFLAIVNFTVDGNRKLSAPEKITRDIVLVIQNTVNAPFNFIKSKIDKSKDMKRIYNEYKDLDDIREYTEFIVNQNNELKAEIESLNSLLSIEKSLTQYSYLNANVVMRNSGFWYNTLTIDKGNVNKIAENMAVITKEGLVGRIIKTSYFHSDVKLISDNNINNKIAVKIVNDKEHYGIITGYNTKDNYLVVEGISNTVSIKVGDVVTTSGLGGIFPRGILIGKVVKITTDSFDLAKIIEVTPSADLNNIKHVTILKRVDN